jgi:rubredoxin---NAD+ reductase
VTTTEDALEARYTAPERPDALLGFVLQGKAVAQRQALAAQVPSLLG